MYYHVRWFIGERNLLAWKKYLANIWYFSYIDINDCNVEQIAIRQDKFLINKSVSGVHNVLLALLMTYILFPLQS